MSNTRTDTTTLLTLTLVASFCSFVCEFVYSGLLAVIYGGTVTQYAITVRLCFFSLGIGAMLSDDLDGETLGGSFFRTEMFSATTTPAGLLLTVGLNNVRTLQAVPVELVWTTARLPVVVVGFPSGFELPLLTHMFNDLNGDGSAIPSWPQTAGTRIHDFVVAAVGALWTVEWTEGRRNGLSVVLAMDYVGSLVGIVIYTHVPYPGIGLTPTIPVLALLNGIATLVFVAHFGT